MTSVHPSSPSIVQSEVDPYDSVEWSHRRAEVGSFVAESVEFPTSWSDAAVNIVAQKYMRVIDGERETSLRQVISRVVNTVVAWATEIGTVQHETGAFHDSLVTLLLDQRLAFNSPVWFNIGVPGVPQQGSACFILSVEDTMPSILDWYREEGMIFKGGSGAGINLSNLRSSAESLRGGGTASGPVSFMRGADASAGAIKSGGTTRRAAKMVVLDDSHPDIEEFVWCKAKEERKAHALAEAGFDMGINGGDIGSVQFQNANNSVRISDEFMRAVIEDRAWDLKAVTTGEIVRSLPARDLLRDIAQAAWECADPGVQFTDTINRWHTLPVHSPINASNPCSEYLSIDNSACNLASINLLKYATPDGTFDMDGFVSTVMTAITAMDAIATCGDYPTETISTNARKYRQLGLGYTNLGALLMTMGVPYDSDDGRSIAAAITSLMTAAAYASSAVLAMESHEPFADWQQHAPATLDVIAAHQSQAGRLRDAVLARNGSAHSALRELVLRSCEVWTTAMTGATQYGVRNSQVTVLAPTGTVSFMMDADTTGIEPSFSLVAHKTLVGGGQMEIVNQSVPEALRCLNYSDISDALAHVREHGTIVGAPSVQSEHYPVFATAVGDNAISWEGHIRMLGAVQPFLSGAASKTINMPADTTVEEIEEAISMAWSLGVKCLAIYRDGCKVAQPLSTDDGSSPEVVPVRHKLPRTRTARTTTFRVGDTKGYLTVGEYDDGRPGEIFLKVAKQGSTLAAIMDGLAIAVSHGLQYGVPLEAFVNAFKNQMFEPRGFTDDPEIRTAQSLLDYVFRRLEVSYLLDRPTDHDIITLDTSAAVRTGEICHSCGSMMLRSGTCWSCPSCGSTTGCG